MYVGLVDCETTGFTPNDGKIVEIGIVIADISSKTIVHEFGAIIKHDKINENAWIFSNSDFQAKDVYNAKHNIYALKPLLQDYFIRYPFTAFRKAFDFEFLQHENIIIFDEMECLMQKSKELMSENGFRKYNVQFSYNFMYNENYVEKHRALDDVKHEAKILFKLVELNRIEKMLKSDTLEKERNCYKLNVVVIDPIILGYDKNYVCYCNKIKDFIGGIGYCQKCSFCN